MTGGGAGREAPAGAGAPLLVHGTALVVAGRGVLLRGAARSGKSALAFMALRRAEAAGVAARLLADDRVWIEPGTGGLVMAAPERLAGLIELSGVGILGEAPHGGTARLDLLVDLLADPSPERLPEPRAAAILGQRPRRIVMPEREAALGAEILLHLARDGFAGLDAAIEAS